MNNPQRLNLLIIDDSNVDTFLIKNEIEESEFIHKVNHFDNPEHALEWILSTSMKDRKDLPDLILLDVNMPVYSGFELVSEIEETGLFEEEFPFKIFLLTSSNMLRDKEKYSTEGNIHRFIQKPLRRASFDENIIETFGFGSVG